MLCTLKVSFPKRNILHLLCYSKSNVCVKYMCVFWQHYEPHSLEFLQPRVPGTRLRAWDGLLPPQQTYQVSTKQFSSDLRQISHNLILVGQQFHFRHHIVYVMYKFSSTETKQVQYPCIFYAISRFLQHLLSMYPIGIFYQRQFLKSLMVSCLISWFDTGCSTVRCVVMGSWRPESNVIVVSRTTVTTTAATLTPACSSAMPLVPRASAAISRYDLRCWLTC